MSKVKTISLIILVLSLSNGGCDILDNDSDSQQQLQEVGSFPMEIGTAWVYETEEKGGGYNITRTDTLFLFDTYEDYYALSYEPFQEAMLFKQNNEMVTDEGYVDENGNVEFYDSPYLQFMYKETDGFVETSKYSEYSWWRSNAYLKVTHFDSMDINGKTYEDVYELIISLDEALSSTYGKMYYNSQGMLKVVEHDESDGTYESTSILTEILTDTYPDNSVLDSEKGGAQKLENGTQKSFWGKLMPGS
ncbi:MAG: hypothetical protein ACQETE_00560 [Bacteroidota bacterium]